MADELAEEPVDGGGLPLFCPRCGDTFKAGRRACPKCSARLVVQGYCTVCHSSWAIAPGGLCPKHEIELISEPPDPPFDRPDVAGESWVKVAAFARPFEAEAARIRLDAEGIPSLIDGHRMNATYAGQLATGGSRLLVPEVYLQEARILLAQSWDTSTLRDDAIQGEDDPDDPPPKTPRPPAAVQTASFIFWVVALILGPLLIALLQLL